MTKTAEQDYQERLEEFSDRFLVDFFDGLVGTSDVVEFLEGRGIDRDDDLIADLFDQINATLDTMIQRQLDR